jgi:hypothetical protein
MKHRGQLIIDEFELLRSVAGKSGLQLPPEYAQGRQLFRKREQLFKKLKLDPNNEHHVAFLCSIIFDHLYLNKSSPYDEKFGDDKDLDLLLRFLKYAKVSKLNHHSDVCRNFVKKDKAAAAEYRKDATIDRFRVRLDRAAKNAIDDKMKLTVKRRALLQENLPEIVGYFATR